MDESFLRGLESENNVYEALKDMLRTKKIDRFIKTKRNSNDDRQGVDFWVLIRRKWVPLQVKSSAFYTVIHYLQHPTIPVVVGNGPNLKPRIKQALRDYLRTNHHAETARRLL